MAETISNTGNVDDEPKPGRNRKTTEKEDKRITTIVEQNPALSLRSMTSISSKRGININKDTFRSRIIETGFQNVAPTKKPLLSERHVNARLKWAEENTSTDWIQVIFTDEASFHTRVPPRRVWSKIDVKKYFILLSIQFKFTFGNAFQLKNLANRIFLLGS